MIVDERKVEIALEYLNADPSPVAIARKEVTDAANKCKQVYARALLDAEGSVEVKKAKAEIHHDHLTAKDEESDAIFRFDNERDKRDGAKMLIDVWMEESRNIRAAERIR